MNPKVTFALLGIVAGAVGAWAYVKYVKKKCACHEHSKSPGSGSLPEPPGAIFKDTNISGAISMSADASKAGRSGWPMGENVG